MVEDIPRVDGVVGGGGAIPLGDRKVGHGGGGVEPELGDAARAEFADFGLFDGEAEEGGAGEECLGGGDQGVSELLAVGVGQVDVEGGLEVGGGEEHL